MSATYSRCVAFNTGMRPGRKADDTAKSCTAVVFLGDAMNAGSIRGALYYGSSVPSRKSESYKRAEE